MANNIIYWYSGSNTQIQYSRFWWLGSLKLCQGHTSASQLQSFVSPSDSAFSTVVMCLTQTKRGSGDTSLLDKSNMLKLNHTLTLFFSYFQLSSCARICSTTDMASRPCRTYSFSWSKSERRKENHQRTSGKVYKDSSD